VVSSKGGRAGYVAKSRHAAYRKIKAGGNSKSKSAAIANAGVTKAGRSAMARKAARTSNARGR
jgi:hypothetical protein